MFAIPHAAPCSPHQPARATLPTATTSAKELSDPRGPELALAVESARSPEVRGFRARFVGAMPFPGSRRGHQVSPESSLLGQLCRFAGGHRREALDPLQERIKRCTARARGPLIPQLSGRRFAQAQGPRQSFHVQKRRPGLSAGLPHEGRHLRTRRSAENTVSAKAQTPRCYVLEAPPQGPGPTAGRSRASAVLAALQYGPRP